MYILIMQTEVSSFCCAFVHCANECITGGDKNEIGIGVKGNGFRERFN